MARHALVHGACHVQIAPKTRLPNPKLCVASQAIMPFIMLTLRDNPIDGIKLRNI